jgi:hypothetical protein
MEIFHSQPHFECFTGLPGGIFAYQKSQFGSILEGLGMENVVFFNGHLEYFTVIEYILWPSWYSLCLFDIYFPVLV